MTNQKRFLELPPDYKGKPWSVATLQGVSPDEMRKLLRLYGATAINAALQRHASNGGGRK